jgi:cytochrome b6-f complex iron-sulfur subunit
MTSESATNPGEKPRINRREFLNIAWLASLGFLTVSVAGATYLFAMPRFEAGEFGGVYSYGPVSSLPSSDAPPANEPQIKLWISNTETGVMALYKVCTHLGCLYNWNEQEVKFICPCHGSQFQKDGKYIQGPAPRSLDRFPIWAEDPTNGQVIAKSEDGSPLPVPEDPNALIKVDTGKRIKGLPHG